MVARVVQIDFSKPLVDIPIEPGCPMLMVFIRYGVRPIARARVYRSNIGSVFTVDMQRRVLGQGLGPQIIDAVSRQAHLPARVPHTPPISIVICTREHPELLRRQLASMTKLIYPKFEVIVVDNAPNTNLTRKVCDEFEFVRYVLEPRKGLDFARNSGWQAARYGIVAYTDDDACVDPHWLQGLAQPYSDPRVHAVTGITFPLELETPAQLMFEDYGGMQRGFEKKIYRPGTWNTFYPLGSGRFGAGVNLSVRREALEAMGGFDPALDVGSLGRGGGDLDIMARVIRDGGTLVYEPAAVVWHQHRKTMKELRKQMFDYGWGLCAYAAKHMDDLELSNVSLRMLRRWGDIWGKQRLMKSIKASLRGQKHFPVHLILLEIIGGIIGVRAYKRSVANAVQVHQRALAQEQKVAA